MIAAQLFEAVLEAVPDLTASISAGDFKPLFAWLGEKVHGQGSLMSTAQLVERATGSPIGTVSFERHLRNRYLDRRNEPA